ncbi:MAG: hypothetical protein ACPH4N_03485 [Flavobacteriaceae bacterium]
MRLLFIFCLSLCFVQCYPEESFYSPLPKKNLHLYFQSTESCPILHGHFQVRIHAIDPNTKEKMLLKEDYFWTRTLPFEASLPITEEKWESYASSEKDFYVSIRWDSDGNGVYCNGDLVLDYQIKDAKVLLQEKLQKVYLKKSKGTICVTL